MIKFLRVVSLLCLVQPACGELSIDARPSDFSPWYARSELARVLKNMPKDRYPVIIEAASLLGDGVAFRVLVRAKPSNNFKYRYVYGADEHEFMAQDNVSKKLGFTLLYHQTIQLMGGRAHQGVWVRGNEYTAQTERVMRCEGWLNRHAFDSIADGSRLCHPMALVLQASTGPPGQWRTTAETEARYNRHDPFFGDRQQGGIATYHRQQEESAMAD